MKVGFFIVIFLFSSNLALKSEEPPANRRGMSAQMTTNTDRRSVARKTVTDFMDWIVSKTGWKIKKAPTISFATPAQLNKMQFGKTGGSNGITCKALYKKVDQTVCLSTTWSPGDLRDRSYLIHELVHHLQNLNEVEGACEGAREMQAYKLQFDWLGEQGIRDPQEFLGISNMVFFMLTQCPLYRACEFLPEGCQD